jgi:lycopene beta-cyclase
MTSHSDVLIVGGGLSGTLTALRFAIAKPDLSVTLIEESAVLGGAQLHTWSFHDTDLSEESRLWLKPLLTRSWDEHTVIFPKFTRQVKSGYHSIRSEDLARVLTERFAALPNFQIRLKTRVDKIDEASVTCQGGDVLIANLVLDARGNKNVSPENSGFQKFIGYDVLLEEPHGITAPVLKDVNCPQLDGYRFFYLLPWDEKRILIEETYYSDDPSLNADRIGRSIRSYAARRGWKIQAVERIEQGVLQIPMTSQYIKTALEGEALLIGALGGFYHATTGFSLPDAVRIAEFLTSLSEHNTQYARESLAKFRRPFLSRQRFYRMLNRLLFIASEPSLRFLILQRFYELPGEVIERFYAGESTWSDRLRILTGRPPVPLVRAFRSFSETSAETRWGRPGGNA